jgi:predicted transcriptional regulator
VFRFLKDRVAKPVPLVLGPLELMVMEIVWARPHSSVRDVSSHLERPLAYTTVMTTLDRLYKKGMLVRRKDDRAFVYTASLTRDDWGRKQAGELVAGLLANPRHSTDLLISCLVDTVGEHDNALLDELERKIQIKRKEFQRRKP